MSANSWKRIARTLLQGGAAIPLIAATIALLRAFGVPVAQDQEQAIVTFALALGGLLLAVIAWNATEDLTGRSVLKDE